MSPIKAKVKTISKYVVLPFKICYYAFLLVALFIVELDILKASSHMSAWYVILVFILWVCALFYAMIDTFNQIEESREKDKKKKA